MLLILISSKTSLNLLGLLSLNMFEAPYRVEYYLETPVLPLPLSSFRSITISSSTSVNGCHL